MHSCQAVCGIQPRWRAESLATTRCPVAPFPENSPQGSILQQITRSPCGKPGWELGVASLGHIHVSLLWPAGASGQTLAVPTLTLCTLHHCQLPDSPLCLRGFSGHQGPSAHGWGTKEVSGSQCSLEQPSASDWQEVVYKCPAPSPSVFSSAKGKGNVSLVRSLGGKALLRLAWPGPLEGTRSVSASFPPLITDSMWDPCGGGRRVGEGGKGPSPEESVLLVGSALCPPQTFRFSGAFVLCLKLFPTPWAARPLSPWALPGRWFLWAGPCWWWPRAVGGSKPDGMPPSPSRA